MKKIKIALCSLSLIFAFTGTMFLASTVTGCKTSQATIAYKSIASVQSGVEVALNAWAQYVTNRKREISAMPEGPEQNAAVIQLASRELKARAALESYKAAAVAAVSVARSGGDPAPSSLVSAASKFTSVTAN
tara:strand:- start:238 stop:636 length:399 start_codon:yes stop_codon:yes gene_type:complete